MSSQRPALKLPNVDPKLISYILDEVIEHKPHVKFDDIGKICFSSEFLHSEMCIVGGQEAAKRALEEAVILPVLRPEVY